MTHLALHAPFDPSAWWQLWSCHLMHWNVRHLILNVIVAGPAIAIAPRRALRQWLISAPFVAPLLAIAVVASGFRGEYRGASGLVVSLWAFVGIVLVSDRCWRAAVLLVPLSLKLVAEWAGLWPAASADFTTVAAIHYAGAAAGAIAACVLRNGDSFIHSRLTALRGSPRAAGGKP